jgi:transforming growth factor-beta-induced protein
MKRLFPVFALLALFVVSASAADIVDTAAGAGSFNTLVTAVKAAGLVEALKAPGPYTVFAPTDDAFKKLPAGVLEKLLANPAKLAEVLKYHVVSGKVGAAQVITMNGKDVMTLEGSDIKIHVSGGVVKVDKATVIKTDIGCDNGVIHVIDSVMLPKNFKL